MIVLFKCFQSHGFKRKTGPPSAAGFSAGPCGCTQGSGGRRYADAGSVESATIGY